MVILWQWLFVEEVGGSGASHAHAHLFSCGVRWWLIFSLKCLFLPCTPVYL